MKHKIFKENAKLIIGSAFYLEEMDTKKVRKLLRLVHKTFGNMSLSDANLLYKSIFEKNREDDLPF